MLLICYPISRSVLNPPIPNYISPNDGMVRYIGEAVSFARCCAVSRERDTRFICMVQRLVSIDLGLVSMFFASFWTCINTVPLVKLLSSNHRGSEERGKKLKQNFRNSCKLLQTVVFFPSCDKIENQVWWLSISES